MSRPAKGSTMINTLLFQALAIRSEELQMQDISTSRTCSEVNISLITWTFSRRPWDSCHLHKVQGKMVLAQQWIPSRWRDRNEELTLHCYQIFMLYRYQSDVISGLSVDSVIPLLTSAYWLIFCDQLTLSSWSSWRKAGSCRNPLTSGSRHEPRISDLDTKICYKIVCLSVSFLELMELSSWSYQIFWNLKNSNHVKPFKHIETIYVMVCASWFQQSCHKQVRVSQAAHRWLQHQPQVGEEVHPWASRAHGENQRVKDWCPFAQLK